MGYFNEYSDKKMYIHCRSGNDRTGVVNALHRVWKQGLDDGVNFEDIRQEMIDSGHHTNGLFPDLIKSLSRCLRYMGINPDKFGKIENAQGEKNFLWNFYQANRNDVKHRADLEPESNCKQAA